MAVPELYSTIPEALSGEFRGLLKLRVGPWRILYVVDRKARILKIQLVGHRSEIYRL